MRSFLRAASGRVGNAVIVIRQRLRSICGSSHTLQFITDISSASTEGKKNKNSSHRSSFVKLQGDYYTAKVKKPLTMQGI